MYRYNSILNSRFLNMYCTDTIQSRTQGSFNLYRTDRYNSISNSWFLNMYPTDTTQSQTQGSSICIVQIQLNHELKVPQHVSYRFNWITNSRFLNIYCTDTAESRTQGSSICMVQLNHELKVPLICIYLSRYNSSWQCIFEFYDTG